MALRRSIMGFDQEEVLKLTKVVKKEVKGDEKEVELKLDLNDLLILKQVADFPNRKKITKIIIDEKIFFWVSYKEIIEELPILGIGKQALSDRLDKMVRLGVLEREIKTMPPYANMTLFRIGDKYEQLKYKIEDLNSDGIVSNYDRVSYQTTIGYRSETRHINNEYNNRKDDNKEETLEKKEWREDFNAYMELVNKAKRDLLSDSEYKAYIGKYYPNADYENSVGKLVDGFWGKQEGWNYCKKKRKGKTINMLATLKKNLDARSRIVYKQKNGLSLPDKGSDKSNDKLFINGVEYR